MKQSILIVILIILLFACFEISLRLCDIVTVNAVKIFNKSAVVKNSSHKLKTAELFYNINKFITEKSSQMVK